MEHYGQKAVELYQKLADQGVTYAQCNLARRYDDGIGLESENSLIDSAMLGAEIQMPNGR